MRCLFGDVALPPFRFTDHSTTEQRPGDSGCPMSSNEQALLDKLKALPPQQRAEVEDFVDFLTARARKRAAIDRLLAIAPALEAAGVEPMSDEEINAEIKAARAERRARKQQEQK